MSDIAELGVKVTSSGINQASDQLKALEKSTAGAENAASKAERQMALLNAKVQESAAFAKMAAAQEALYSAQTEKLAAAKAKAAAAENAATQAAEKNTAATRLQAGIAKGLGSAYDDMAGSIGRAIGSGLAFTAVLYGIGKAASAVIDAQKEIDKLNRGFTVLAGGDTVEAAKNIAWIREESKRLGLEVSDASDSFLKWQGSIKGTSLEGEAGRRIFSAFAGAAANLGSSAENTNGILSALGQIASKGVVSMEELRGQLGDRMPGAMQIAARSMNVTTSELVKMVSEGKVAAETFLMGFASQVEKEMGTGGQQVDTMTAAMNRFGNAWNERMQAIANSGFGEMLKDLVSDMATLIGVDSEKTKSADAIILQRKELEILEEKIAGINDMYKEGAGGLKGWLISKGAWDEDLARYEERAAAIKAELKYQKDMQNEAKAAADAEVAASKLKAAQAAKEAEAKAAQAKAEKEAEKVKKQLIQAIQDEKDSLEIANTKLKEGELSAYRLTLAKKGMIGATQNELVALKAQNIALEQQTEADKKAKDAAQASADLYAGKMKDARVSYLRLTEDYNAKAQEELGITDALNPKVEALAAAYQKAADAKKLVSQASKIDDVMASIRVDVSTTGDTAGIAQANAEAAKLQEVYDQRMTVIEANTSLEQMRLVEKLNQELITEDEYQQLSEEQYNAYMMRKSQATEAYNAKIKQSDDQLQAARTRQNVTALNAASQFFGNMAQIAAMGGKEQFQRYKNLASAQAAIGAAASIVAVLADNSIQPTPLRIGLAMSMGALATAQVAQIRAQEYSGRAAGGQMLGGTTYKVNENGDELITTKDGGAVTSAKVINQLIAAAQNNGGGVIINNYSSAEFTQRKTSNGLTVFDVRDIARETVSSDIARGGNSISSAAESTWGLNRAAGA